MKCKWKRISRLWLFDRVLRDHGPWSTWNSKQRPPALNVKEWSDYSRKLAQEMNEIFRVDPPFSHGGPAMQVEWATSWGRGQPNLDNGYIMNFIWCMAAAHEAGFLVKGEYPKHMKIVKDES